MRTYPISKWNFSQSGQLCPRSHPIPCVNGALCTSMVRPLDPNYCTVDDLKNGLCCPENNVPCKYNKPHYTCQAHPKFGMTQSQKYLLQYLPCLHRTGITCPQSHPIPCMRGSYCTSRQLSYNENNCNASAIADGICCPEDAVPCKADDPNFLCRANPDYGRKFNDFTFSKHSYQEWLDYPRRNGPPCELDRAENSDWP